MLLLRRGEYGLTRRVEPLVCPLNVVRNPVVLQALLVGIVDVPVFLLSFFVELVCSTKT